MKDILKAAGMGAALIFGMYAAGGVCAVVTNALVKKDEGKETTQKDVPQEEKANAWSKKGRDENLSFIFYQFIYYIHNMEIKKGWI